MPDLADIDLARIDLKRTMVPRGGIEVKVEGYETFWVGGHSRISLMQAISYAYFFSSVEKKKKPRGRILELDYDSKEPHITIILT